MSFVVDTGEQIVPVEIKAEVNLRAKSLKTYQEKFSPEISVRTSMADCKKEECLVNLPLYAIDQIKTTADTVHNNLPDMPISIYDAGIRILPKKGNKVIAELMTSYFDKHWSGRHSYDTYMPYASKTGETVILQNKNVLHIAFPVFTSYRLTGYPVYKDLIGNCVDLLCGERLLKIDAPSFTRAGITEKMATGYYTFYPIAPKKEDGIQGY